MNIWAATGHRPDKLGGYTEQVTNATRRLAESYLATFRPDSVISGMALGWDMAWAEAAIDLGLPVTAAVPFDGQESRWPVESRSRYWNILERCELVRTICDGGFSPNKMQLRNRWMVDNCTALVALWDGSKGGTCNCIRYAVQTGTPVANLWEHYEV